MIAEDVAFFFSLGGLIVWLKATGAYRRQPMPEPTDAPADWSQVSVVIPCRNEAGTIFSAVQSVLSASQGRCELVMVDDHSTDSSAEEAKRALLSSSALHRIITPPPCPPDWSGKNWACHQGVLHTSRKYILFIDADVELQAQGACQALAQAQSHGWDLTTAIPWHKNPTWWEQCMALFYGLLFVPTAPYQEPENGRIFAVGQFLLFKRTAYEKIGGHAAIKQVLAEDVTLARIIHTSGLSFMCWTGETAFHVRMYPTFKAWLTGWRRNLRLGFGHSNLRAVAELVLVFSLWLNPLIYGFKKFPVGVDPWLGGLTVIAFIWLIVGSREWGRFKGFGGATMVIGIPISLLSFFGLSGVAALDQIRKRSVSWKDRIYKI